MCVCMRCVCFCFLSMGWGGGRTDNKSCKSCKAMQEILQQMENIPLVAGFYTSQVVQDFCNSIELIEN